jgi:hypothetical protein
VNAVLELPELGRAPRAYTVYHASPVSAKVALAMLDGTYGHHAGSETIAAPVIARVLDGWLKELQYKPGDPQATTLAARMHGGRSVYRFRVEYKEDEDGSFRIDLNAKSGAPTQCALGKGLRAAEQVTGLGQSALSALAHAADASVPILLPETMLRMAAGRKFMVEYLGKYAAWMLSPAMLPRESLQRITKRSGAQFPARLARAILAVEDAVAKIRELKLPTTSGQLTTFPLIVHCEKSYDYKSGHMQLLDAYRNQRQEEQRSLFHMTNAARSAASIGPVLEYFLTSIAKTAPVLRAVDALVLILEGEQKNV